MSPTDSERIGRLEVIAGQHTLVLEKISMNVESLLVSRSYIRGAWRAVATVAGVVAFIVSAVAAWLRH